SCPPQCTSLPPINASQHQPTTPTQTQTDRAHSADHRGRGDVLRRRALPPCITYASMTKPTTLDMTEALAPWEEPI
ncbi:MAG: hypothetical protein AAFS10_15155, partial [Myxococcota bacterium]